MLGKSSECSISRSLDCPLSFVTNITPGIIITSHAPVLTALNKSAMKKFKGTFLIQESFRYYTEDRDHEMDMWVVVGDTENKFLTLVVTPYKVSTRTQYISTKHGFFSIFNY